MDDLDLKVVLDALEGIARQSCHTGEDGLTDSMAIGALGEALEVLESYGRFRFFQDPIGRRVLGYWPELDPMCRAE